MKEEVTIHQILKATTKELWTILKKHLAGYYNDSMFLDSAFLFLTNYTSPIMLQAHVDTRRDERTELKLNIENNIITGNGILGADDRAGVFAIIRLVQWCHENKVSPPTVLFTDHEETGSAGMKKFINHTKNKKFRKLRLCIAMDRQGCGQFVYYNDIHKKVEQYMESFGFDHRHGSFSDISLFQKETNIPAVNVSVGYESQHTIHEKLKYDELWLTINRLKLILVTPIKERFEVDLKKKEIPYTYDDKTYRYCGNQTTYDFNSKKYYFKAKCGACGLHGEGSWNPTWRMFICRQCENQDEIVEILKS